MAHRCRGRTHGGAIPPFTGAGIQAGNLYLNVGVPIVRRACPTSIHGWYELLKQAWHRRSVLMALAGATAGIAFAVGVADPRSEEHTSELQSHSDLVCRLLLEKKK